MTKSYWTVRHLLPHWLARPLFGDRKRFGRKIKEEDQDWQIWESAYMDFHQTTQKQGLGKIVNDIGYQVMQKVNLEGKKVFEIGPGILPHKRFWKGKPKRYAIADVEPEFLKISKNKLKRWNIPVTARQTTSYRLPFKNNQFDLVVSFYTLEHLHPFNLYLKEMLRILKPGGIFLGSIPSEGGLAWGLGRFLTTRNYMIRKMKVNPDKLLAWTHPNFAEDILKTLDRHLTPLEKTYWPLCLPIIDLNLVINFIYQK